MKYLLRLKRTKPVQHPSHHSYIKYKTIYNNIYDIIYTGFQSAQKFNNLTEIISFFADVDEKVNVDMFDIINLSEMPMTEEFANAIHLTPENIPRENSPVSIVYRDGTRSGVSGNFLRKEMIRGRFICDPEFCRYVYD